MGGFLAALGGFGQGLHSYGEQVRGQLEARRTELAGHVSRMAQEESDPGTRDSLNALYTDIHRNKPIDQLVQQFHGLMTKRQKSTENMTQLVGSGPGAPVAPPPGPTPVGATAGQGGNMLVPTRPGPPSSGIVGQSMLPSAAQPQSSPVQGGGLLPSMPWDQPQQPSQAQLPPMPWDQPQSAAAGTGTGPASTASPAPASGQRSRPCSRPCRCPCRCFADAVVAGTSDSDSYGSDGEDQEPS
jgi:hypothetical protein